MWPVANVAFGMAAPEKTIHYCGEFPEGRKARVFRKQKEPGVGKEIGKTMRRERAEIEKRAAAKGSGRLASETEAERLRSGGQGWDQHLGLRRAKTGDVIVSGGGIAYLAARTIGASRDRVEIGAQARFSNGVHRRVGGAQVCFAGSNAL